MPARADGRGHGLVYQEHLAGLRAQRAVSHGPPLDLRDFRRHADDDARADPGGPRLCLANEVGQHPFRGFEVGDDAVAQRPDRRQVLRRAADHLPGFSSDGLDPAGHRVIGDDRRLVQDDATARRVDAGVGRAEVDGQIGVEPKGANELHERLPAKW
jgi:hypothetical protein